MLDTNFNELSIIDTFESLIWTQRYNDPGDFELYTSTETLHLEDAKLDNYVRLKGTDQVMIIETIKVSTNPDSGVHLTISGRSLDSILYRRIIWPQIEISGNLQNGIKKLIDANVITPESAERKISNFTFSMSEDSRITSLTHSGQYTGDNLYEVIQTICKNNDIGFLIELDDQNKFVFRLYAGTDRSYNQVKNPYVIFSPSFNNIVNSEHEESKIDYKNVTIVAGEGEGTERKTAIVGSIASDLSRRELYTDARDIQMTKNEDNSLAESLSDYFLRLINRGNEKLSEYKELNTFDGEVEAIQSFIYGRDFYIGDILQFVNELGVESTVRVTSMIRSQDENGYQTYPTFEMIENEKEGD